MKETNVPKEPKVEQATPVVTETIIDITPFNKDEETNALVEEKRSVFEAENKASQKRSTTSITIIMILSVIAMIFLYKGPQAISYICMGAAVLTLIIFAVINKRIKSLDPKVYIKDVTTILNKDVFGENKDFKNTKYFPERKLNLENSDANYLYANLVSCGSRNYVESTYKGKEINAIECALFSGQGKARATHFVGRRVEMSNTISKDAFVLLSKIEPVNDQLSAVGEYKEKELSKNYILYSIKSSDDKVLPKAFLDAIKTIKIEKHLLNLSVIIKPGKTVAFMSYDDASLEVPFNNPLNKDCLEQYKKDLSKLLDAFLLLAGK